MLDRNVNVQVIGFGTIQFSKSLRQRGIIAENFIDECCNPLSMAGKYDTEYLKYATSKDLSMTAVLNVKKNLSQMLSHNPETFSPNYNTQPMGIEVREKNTSEYLIYMGTNVIIPVYEKNGVAFSSMWPGNNFVSAIYADKSFTKRIFPFSPDFNWKYYYDQFIEAVKKEYDKEHIIFIKTNASYWYMENDDVKAFDSDVKKFSGLLSEMDEYFIKKTHCYVVQEQFNHFPSQKVNCWHSFFPASREAYDQLADAVCDIIEKRGIDEYEPLIPKGESEFARLLQIKLSSAILNDNQESVRFIEKHWFSLSDIKNNQLDKSDSFFSDLVKLEIFLNTHSGYSLSDYSISLTKNSSLTDDAVNIELIELYTEYFKLNINDIIAVYMLYLHLSDKSLFKGVITNIINNPDCLPVKAAMKLKNSNLKCIKNYPYISDEYKNSSENDEFYIRLENNIYLVLNIHSEELIKRVHPISKDIDHIKIIKDKCVCSADCADALTYSYKYYIEKARIGYGTNPTFLKFNCIEDFHCSLCYINYSELLKNEKFVFVIGDENMEIPNDYSPIVDFTIFFDPDLVTVNIEAGLGDQLCNYVMGKVIEKYTGKKVIFNTTKCVAFNGFEVNKLAKSPVNLLVDKLSHRLTPLNDYSNQLYKKLYLEISHNYTYMTNSLNYKRYERDALSYPAFLCGENKKTFIEFQHPYLYYNILLRIEGLKEFYDFNLRDFIEFPPFDNKEHIALADKISSCDSIIVHVRRGDYVTAGCATDNDFFKKNIKAVMKIGEYTQKIIFVFSDDIKWCKENKEQIGLDAVDCEVVFVDGNKTEDSFRDAQLMSLGKVIIAGQSYFPTIAAHYSDTMEMYLCSNNIRSSLFEKYVKKNKYDIGDYINLDSDTSKNNAPSAAQNQTIRRRST